jgi:hypothetical protein
MALFNTNDYNVYLDIPDDVKFTFYHLSQGNILDIDKYLSGIYQSSPKDSMIILWGACNRLITNDQRFETINQYYKNNPNPLIVFNGAHTTAEFDFPYKEVCLFPYIVKSYHVNVDQPLLDKAKKFLFASSKDYPARRYLLNALYENDLFNQGFISYKCLVTDPTCDGLPMDLNQQVQDLLPLKGFDNTVEFYQIPRAVHDHSYLSIVTETYFTGPVYLSEKVFNAVAKHQLFIYLGPAYSLKQLQNMGYKTFGHVIDESYDDIEDPSDRLAAVSKAMIEFLSQPIEQIKKIYWENLDIITHNRKLLYQSEINREIVSAIQSAIQ